jgi:hypothetical protein
VGNIKINRGSSPKIPVTIIIAIFSILIICASPALGEGTPILPHRFYGNVTISDQAAPPGTEITAIVQGGWGSFTTTELGIYGSNEFLGEKFEVQGDIEEPTEIKFKINNIDAECRPGGSSGPWLTGYPFSSGANTNLDLRSTGPVYVIVASAGIGGNISPSGNVQVVEGANKLFTIIPDVCNTILDVKVDSVSLGAVPTYTFYNVTDDHTINATFASKTVYVTASAGQGGNISPTGQQPVPCGGNITFTITPSTGYLIDDVVVNGSSKGAVSVWTIDPVIANQTIVASFTPVTFVIQATAGSNGNISPAGDITVNYGDDKAFTMIPDTGYTIDEILVDGGAVTRTPVYTFHDVVTNHNISVSFMEGAPEYFAVTLGDGWNLFSTPIKLDSGHQHLEDIFPSGSLENIEVILGWDGSAWFIPGYGYDVKPLSAVYVKVHDSATAFLYPSTAVSPPPTRSLAEGLNLIGPAPNYQNGGFQPRSVEDSLITVYGNSTNPGYLIVVSPGLNQPSWSYVRDGEAENLLPYKGYWVIMENPGTLAGFSTTPIS